MRIHVSPTFPQSPPRATSAELHVATLRVLGLTAEGALATLGKTATLAAVASSLGGSLSETALRESDTFAV